MKRYLNREKMNLSAEMCYPIEVLVGHYREIAKMEPDYIYIPEVLDLEPLPWAAKMATVNKLSAANDD
jgi:predicted nucleotide-binding protein (sugar kinase/HSP70/actin superfamily)